jgi:DNA processing protein
VADSEPIRLSDSQRLDWLRLIRSENVGPRTFRSLLNHCGGAGAALAALPEFARRGGAARPLRICSRDEAEQEIAAAARIGARFVALGEADYPSHLQVVDDAPPLLAIRGDTAVLHGPLVAIVGSRNASAAGVKMAERLARDLGAAGFGVVSGLARGIDAAAHRASLASGTVAVLAGGHDRIYPADHAPLLNDILENGAAVSEMPLGWEPRARDFPRRNRLISGLSVGVVIVEAAQRSGSLITARFALEQGREVFAVPGSPLDPRARGCNDLLRHGATLTETAEDVLSQLGAQLRGVAPPRAVPAMSIPAPPPWSPPAVVEPADNDAVFELILERLGPTPVAVDELVRQCQMSAAAVATLLLELELVGRVERHPGNFVSLR